MVDQDWLVEPTYSVVLREGEITGGDTVIARCPAEIVHFLKFVDDLGSNTTVVGGPIPTTLVKLGVEMAERFTDGSLFRDGQFWITDDPITVEAYGMMPEHADCENCRQGVRQALGVMEAEPGVRLIVGQLHWTLP